VLDAPQPEAILNPHAAPSIEPPAAEPSSTQTAGLPQMVVNPFVDAEKIREVENLARVE
jgi:hypothetical protein